MIFVKQAPFFFLLQSPARRPQVYIDLVILLIFFYIQQRSHVIVAVFFLFCQHVFYFCLKQKETVAAESQFISYEMCLREAYRCVLLNSQQQNVRGEGAYGHWNTGWLALALCGHPHMFVASLSCGFFFLHVGGQRMV